MNWTTRTALELIGQCGLGICRVTECFRSSHSYPFTQVTVLITLTTARLVNIAWRSKIWCWYLAFCLPISDPFFRRFFRPTIFTLAAYVRLIPFFVKLGPPGFRRFLMQLIPNKSVRMTREIVDVMYRTSVQIFEHKRLALQQGDESVLQRVGRGKDIMSILCRCHFFRKFS